MYLLGPAIRAANEGQAIKLDALNGSPIILSTDDDGIWPIEQCTIQEHSHRSLVAEANIPDNYLAQYYYDLGMLHKEKQNFDAARLALQQAISTKIDSSVLQQYKDELTSVENELSRRGKQQDKNTDA
ncbi:unnamed protein product [Rotaria sordida]|uniref:Tetratricopeptide repeat protein n=1 Tax=Rotaria sordida TaxID=392033 RepID=A0A815GTS3_9BILA|nr:unnamed protein product [Rotaria sordida]CAF3976235.1 unnamed protein product [Rotaria sordida]